MNSGVFRKKSLERVSSPEQLNDYIRVSNPSVWLILGAVIILLAGVIVWGAAGALNTSIKTHAVWTDEGYVCYLTGDEAQKVKSGMQARLGGEQATVTAVGAPVSADDIMAGLDDYYSYVLNIAPGGWLHEARLTGDKGEALVECEIVTESISPISFILG